MAWTPPVTSEAPPPLSPPDASKTIREDLDFVSNRISEQVRQISLGILAFVWLFLSGGEKAPILPSKPDTDVLLWAALLSLGAMGFDYLQYVVSFFNSSAALRRAEADDDETSEEAPVLYDYGSALYVGRTVLFWLKQGSVVASSVLLVWSVVKALQI